MLLAASLGTIGTTADLYAQSSSTAQLAGQVVDTKQVPVDKAVVRVIDTERNNVHVAVTDKDGHYLLPNLEVAPYRLEVTHDGFRTLIQRAIVLHVGDNREIDLTLTAGTPGEEVIVQAGANLIQTEQSAVSQIISRKTILEVPLNGRNPTQLVLISGASVVALNSGGIAGTKNYPSSTAISIAGGQPAGTNYLLDGGSNIDTFSNVNLPLPFPDALQEFGVATSTLPARNGFLSGGLVTVVTKSGGNDLHGNLFEFVRNGIFNAQNRFSTLPDALKRNQFGGTVGGKVIKDKLFFFGGYQATRLVSRPGNSSAYVPTALELAGDFSVAESAACQASGKAHAPLVGYANNRISTPLDPAALALVKYLPTTTDPCGKVGFGIKSVQNEDQYIGRIDANVSHRHTAFVRYFNAKYTNPAPYSATNILVTASPGIAEQVNAVTAGDYFTLTPRLLNAFHGTFTRRGELRSGSPSQINPHTLGVNVVTPYANDLHVAVSNDFAIGCSTCAPFRSGVTSFELADDFDYVRGPNHFGFGMSVLRSDNNIINAFDANGIFAFNGGTTGDPMADFLTGSLGSFSQSKPVVQAFRETTLSPYVQDTVRLNRRLVLSVGARWEPHFFPVDVLNRGAVFSPANFAAGVHSTVYPGAPAGAEYYGDPGVPASFAEKNWKNVSPRLGFAWDPTGKGRETLRVGLGMMYDTAGEFTLQRLLYNPPGVNEIDLAASNANGFSNPWTAGYNYAGGNPFPITSVKFYPGGVWVNVPRNLRSTDMKQWNLTYQRQVGNDWVFEASYMGNRTQHIWGGNESNPAVYSAAVCAQFAAGCTTKNTAARRVLTQQNPAQGIYYSNVTQVDDHGTASYDGLLVSANHRLTKGISVLVNYTYSHCISTTDESSSSISGAGYMNPANPGADKGSCASDLRHILNASVVQTLRFPGEGLAQKIVGAWQFAPLVRATSGTALTVNSGADYSLTGVGLDSPNYSGTASPYGSTGNKLQYLNAAGFTQNASGTFGNVGRDSLRGPNYLTIDLGLARQFAIWKRLGVEFRCDTFNVINKVNLLAPDSSTQIPGLSVGGINLNRSSSTFGKITSSGDPRIIQLAMKASF
jgi:hypothetical protein